MSDPKRALVTGANKGIGYEIARQLGERGFSVWIGCRDSERGEKAEATLRDSGVDARLLLLDVASDASVAAAAANFAAASDHLEVLVNNAGMAPARRSKPSEVGIDDLRDGTFTITNIGSVGGVAGMAVINHPQTAILGVHRLQRKPVVRGEDEVVFRDVMNLSLSFDHRVIDGAACFNFLNRVVAYLEQPNLLFLEMG